MRLNADQRAFEIHGRRKTAQFVFVEGAGGEEKQAEKSLGRSLIGREKFGISQDKPEGDRSVFLAHHADLVAGGDQLFQSRLAGQSAGRLAVVACLRCRRAVPALIDEGDKFGRVDVHGRFRGRVCRSKGSIP